MLTNVLGGMRRIAKEFLPWTPDYQGGPPLNRDYTVGWAHLERVAADGTKVPVGVFLPEHYVLAEADSLRCQILENEWKVAREAKKLSITPDALKKDLPNVYEALYREEKDKPVRKTSFELAIFPSNKLAQIEHFIEKEYTFLKDRQLPLPAMVSKYRIQPDYLTDVAEAGLVISGLDNRKVNIHNPNPTKREKNLHYAGQILSLALTPAAAVGVALGTIEVLMLAGAAMPVALGVGLVTGYLANKRGKDFSFYDLAESLHRELGLGTESKLIRGKFSPSKTIITSIYLASIAVVTFLAVTGAWSAGLALPFAMLAKAGLGASAIAAVQTGYAGLLAAVAGIATIMGTIYPIRYFDTFSFCDNEIHPTKAVAEALPVAKTVDGFKGKLVAEQDKLLATANKLKHGLSEKQRQEFSGEVKVAFLGWQNRFGAHPAPVVAEEAKKADVRRSPRNLSK